MLNHNGAFLILSFFFQGVKPWIFLFLKYDIKKIYEHCAQAHTFVFGAAR